jgi:hypothetical protein
LLAAVDRLRSSHWPPPDALVLMRVEEAGRIYLGLIPSQATARKSVGRCPPHRGGGRWTLRWQWCGVHARAGGRPGGCGGAIGDGLGGFVAEDVQTVVDDGGHGSDHAGGVGVGREFAACYGTVDNDCHRGGAPGEEAGHDLAGGLVSRGFGDHCAKLWNQSARPFKWTKTPDQIIERICRYCSRIAGPGH